MKYENTKGCAGFSTDSNYVSWNRIWWFFSAGRGNDWNDTHRGYSRIN